MCPIKLTYVIVMEEGTILFPMCRHQQIYQFSTIGICIDIDARIKEGYIWRPSSIYCQLTEVGIYKRKISRKKKEKTLLSKIQENGKDNLLSLRKKEKKHALDQESKI